jgi:hypothetical protein
MPEVYHTLGLNIHQPPGNLPEIFLGRERFNGFWNKLQLLLGKPVGAPFL